MKRSEILKNLKANVIEREEEITNKIIETWKSAETSGDMSSWHIELHIDINDGSVWETGLLSQGSMLKSEWDGTSFPIAGCECWHVGMDGYDYNLEDAIQYEDNVEELEAEYERVKDEYCFGMYDFILERHSEIIDKLDDDYRNILFEELFPAKAEEQYNNFLTNLDDDIEGAEYIEETLIR